MSYVYGFACLFSGVMWLFSVTVCAPAPGSATAEATAEAEKATARAEAALASAKQTKSSVRAGEVFTAVSLGHNRNPYLPNLPWTCLITVEEVVGDRVRLRIGYLHADGSRIFAESWESVSFLDAYRRVER